MATTNQKTQEEVRQKNIEATVSRTEQFLNENQKTLWGVLIAIIIVGLAVLAYSRYVYTPKCEEAMKAAYPAEASFQAGEYELALNGDGNVLGFSQILEEYGAKAGKAAYLYAGICELQSGNFENAISYLKKYKGKDSILAARALGCQGDAYVGLEDYTSAIKCFKAAAARADNMFAAGYLKKAGLAYEKTGDKASALGMYEEIKDKYPQSIEAYDIQRYISAVEE